MQIVAALMESIPGNSHDGDARMFLCIMYACGHNIGDVGWMFSHQPHLMQEHCCASSLFFCCMLVKAPTLLRWVAEDGRCAAEEGREPLHTLQIKGGHWIHLTVAATYYNALYNLFSSTGGGVEYGMHCTGNVF